MNKKLVVVFSLALVLLMSTAVLAQPIRVALVLSGFLGDQSFNDSAYQGLQRAIEDFGIEVRVLESGNPADWEQNLVAMADAGYDLVIASSTQFQEILDRNAGYFPNTKFGIIDGVVEQPNVVSAVFAQNEGSFLAGAVAAMWTQMDHLPGVNSEKIIGWVGAWISPFSTTSSWATNRAPLTSILRSKCSWPSPAASAIRCGVKSSPFPSMSRVQTW